MRWLVRLRLVIDWIYGRYSRWSAPLVGAFLGTLCSAAQLLFNHSDPRLGEWGWVLLVSVGVVIGFLGGLAAMICDPGTRPPPKATVTQVRPTTHVSDPGRWSAESIIVHPPVEEPEPRLLYRFFALIGLLLSILPFFGIGFALLGMAVNRSDRGWPRVVGIISVVVSGLVSLAMAAVFVFAALEE